MDPLATSDLGSLAQSARQKQIKSARNILFVIGVLTVGANAVMMGLARGQVEKAIQAEIAKVGPGAIVDQAKLQQLQEAAVRIAYLVCAVAMLLGVVFIVFGFIVKKYPVPITITSLVLYIGAAVIFGILDPTTLLQGIIIKIVIVVALVKAIQAAIAYQRELAPVPRAEMAQ
jgi:hypothetical protein